MPHASRLRWAPPLLAWVVFVVAFPWLSATFGVPAAALAFLIVAWAAWRGGAVAGALHGVLGLVCITLGFYRSNGGHVVVHDLLTGGLLSLVVGVLLGALVGHLRDLRETIARQARHDPLTGLPNRVTFTAELDRALVRARDAGGTVALAFVDLDGFKPINDRFGHDVGDEVLRLLARRMERELAALGTWGRLGGDEFVLLLADPARASTVREEIQNALRAPFEVDGHAITVGASVGVSEETGGQHDAAFLIRAADHAMYVVKRGRGRRVTDHA